jgi:hypothetical protein
MLAVEWSPQQQSLQKIYVITVSTRRRDGCYEGWLDPPLSRHLIIVLIDLSRVAESGQRHTVVNQSWPHEHTDGFWVFGVVIRASLSPLLSSSVALEQDVGGGRKESKRKKQEKHARLRGSGYFLFNRLELSSRYNGARCAAGQAGSLGCHCHCTRQHPSHDND